MNDLFSENTCPLNVGRCTVSPIEILSPLKKGDSFRVVFQAVKKPVFLVVTWMSQRRKNHVWLMPWVHKRRQLELEFVQQGGC